MRRYRPFRWTRIVLLAGWVVILAASIFVVTMKSNAGTWILFGFALFSTGVWVLNTILQVRLIRRGTQSHD